MTFETDEQARASAEVFAADVVCLADGMLGTRLHGAYLLGSLAHGGFSCRYSDLDLGLFVEDGLSQEDLDAIRVGAVRLSPFWTSRLSIFWSDERFIAGRFPPLDRIDYLDHGRPILERKRLEPSRPSLEELHAYLGGAPFESWTEAARRFADSGELAAKDHKPYVRAHLYAARFCLSWCTGQMASNDDAVTFVKAELPQGLDVACIERALACRQAAADPVELWSDRYLLPGQVDACRALMTR